MITIDVVTGLYAYQAILTAIMGQIRFGEGACLDISMMQSAAAFQAAKIMEHVEFDGTPPPLYVPAGMFRTADGHIVVSGMRDAHFRALCAALDRPDMAADPRWATQPLRIANSEPMLAELRAEFVKRPSYEWIDRLHRAGVLAEKVRNYGDWLDEEQVKATAGYDVVDFGAVGSLPVINVPGFPLARTDPNAQQAPLIGQQSGEILGELGFSATEITQFIRDGVVRQTAA
jgi:crotonobetainyl-CoA:carnitine CoA-transferase CaiB-like acyl-CoA transferase